MEDVGLSEYCLDIAQCESAFLVTRFDKLIANMDDVKARIRFKVTQFQRTLSTQFDELFPVQSEGQVARESGAARYGV
jgi:hypothetical protein